MTKAREPHPAHGEGFIYAIINERNGRRYVGFTAKRVIDRWGAHRKVLRVGRHSNADLQADWNSDGESAFRIETLDSTGDYGYRRLEEEWILRYLRQGARLYNRVMGSKPMPGDILEYASDQGDSERRQRRPARRSGGEQGAGTGEWGVDAEVRD